MAFIEKGVIKLGAKSPPETAQALCTVGNKKTNLSIAKMFILAMFAGVYIGFGAQLMTTVKVGLADVVGSGLAAVIGGSVFSVGLMLVIIAGATVHRKQSDYSRMLSQESKCWWPSKELDSSLRR